jgi:hypothetical protein
VLLTGYEIRHGFRDNKKRWHEFGPGSYRLHQKITGEQIHGKQATYRYILNAFSVFSNEAKHVVDELVKRAMHTNIVTFEGTHPIMKEEYIMQNEVNRYFGQIVIYNFMADSFKVQPYQ